MQRLVLFLGHPTYSLTVTLSCFLLFAGLGSLFANRFTGRPSRAVRAVIVALVLLLLALTLALDPLLHAALELPFAARVALVVAVLAPLNFLMGMPFPLGLARLQQSAPRLVPWALGVNGGAGVVASILCIVLAMEAGFRAVSLFAALAYGLAVLLATTGPLSPGRELPSNPADS
jgi:predicted MFS family arabinose efflux permease